MRWRCSFSIAASERGGDPIDLYVIKPAGVKKPPVILYLFDYPKENDQYLKREFCRLLTKDGFAAVGFVDRAGGNYRLADSSPYKRAGTDGKDPGVDLDANSAAMTALPRRSK